MNSIKFKSLNFITKAMSKTIIMYSFVVILSLINTVIGQECRQINSCKCKFSNGSIIDLTSIGYHNEARFKNVTPTNGENYTYFYNPCFPFTISGTVCSNVAVCQATKSVKPEYQNCGNADNGFIWNSESSALNLIYSADSNGVTRVTNVTLVCSREATVPSLVVKGEAQARIYEMTLTSRCACPDLCRDDHLSAGSVLVILFLIFVSLYLVLGIIHSSLTRGAHGWELIPHYEFWADFPLLVRDGCVFVMNGCKAETAYERI